MILFRFLLPSARLHAVILFLLSVATAFFFPPSALSENAASPHSQSSSTSQKLPTPRGIVFILADDQRFDALSALRPEWFRTPHMDELIAGGALFTNAFVTSSLCSPSRASILTGLYPHRHGVLGNATQLDPAHATFPRLLHDAGWRTAFIGKWHMGGHDAAPQPGFDRWVSFAGQGVYENPTFNIDGEEVPRSGYMTDLLTEYAENFIADAASRDAPFLLYLSHKAVHAPFTPAPRHTGAYADRDYPQPPTMAPAEADDMPEWVREQRHSWHGVDGMYHGQTTYDEFVREYSETLLALDESVGRVRDALAAAGVLDSTLVVLTSDNGFQFGEHGLVDKRTMYETSIRVPLIAHWPEGIPAGSRPDALVVNVDIAPTLLNVAGLAPPASMQGRSFLASLTSDPAASPARTEFVYSYFWEDEFPQTPTIFGLRTDRHKLIRYHGIWTTPELYDLRTDPLERHNLLASFQLTTQPGSVDWVIIRGADPETRKLFLELRGRLRKGMDEIGLRDRPDWAASVNPPEPAAPSR